MAAPADKPTPPEAKPPPRNFLRWLLIAAAVAALAVVATVGWRVFQQVRKERIVARARTFMDKRDWGQAMIAVQWALRVNPRDVAVNRMMAELAEKVGSPQALFWHHTVAKLETAVFANHLKWAESALRFKSLSMAEEALTNVDDAGKKTAAYHELAAPYAYPLHLLGRTEEGLKIMRGLDEKLLTIPAYAGYFGILLVDSSTPAEAAKYLEIAQKGRLLHEESDLIAQASARLARQSGTAGKNAEK